MNILVLGGAGFIGINLIKFLSKKKCYQLTIVDSLDPIFKSTLENLEEELKNTTFIKGDIRNKSLMAKVVLNQDVIINCAAQTSHPISLKNPLLDAEINCLGSLTVLEAIKEFNPAAKYIYVSSSTLIGKTSGETVDETHGEKPLDIYSANKGVAEKYCYIYHKVYGLKTVSLRFSNIYGPYGKNSSDFGFINYFIFLAYHNKEIPIFGNGEQMRNVMYVEDVCELLHKAISSNRIYGDSYFAVHKEHYSISDIANTIVSVFGRGTIKRIPWPNMRKKIEIDNVTITGAKLYNKISWEPNNNLKEGLLKTKAVLDVQQDKI